MDCSSIASKYTLFKPNVSKLTKNTTIPADFKFPRKIISTK